VLLLPREGRVIAGIGDPAGVAVSYLGRGEIGLGHRGHSLGAQTSSEPASCVKMPGADVATYVLEHVAWAGRDVIRRSAGGAWCRWGPNSL
jgi:hypothetical protein